MSFDFHNSLGRFNIGNKSIAIIDFVLTLAAAIIVGVYTESNLFLIIILFFLIGQVSHMLFGIKTAFNNS